MNQYILKSGLFWVSPTWRFAEDEEEDKDCYLACKVMDENGVIRAMIITYDTNFLSIIIDIDIEHISNAQEDYTYSPLSPLNKDDVLRVMRDVENFSRTIKLVFEYERYI